MHPASFFFYVRSMEQQEVYFAAAIITVVVLHAGVAIAIASDQNQPSEWTSILFGLMVLVGLPALTIGAGAAFQFLTALF